MTDEQLDKLKELTTEPCIFCGIKSDDYIKYQNKIICIDCLELLINSLVFDEEIK